jgi:two-component SAPR family response regulator
MALDGKCVLIVEDEDFIAGNLTYAIAAEGGEIIGPVETVKDALDILDTANPDGAILDVKLSGQWSFAVADALAARHIPFIFATATDYDVVPARYYNVPWIEKPYQLDTVCRALADVMATVSKDE